MNKKLMYIFTIFIVAAITCISQPKKTTLRDKAMVNYAFDYLSSPAVFHSPRQPRSFPRFMVTQRRNIALENFIFMVATVNHWIIHRRDTGMSNQRNRKIHARKVNWGGSTSKVWGSNPTPVKQFSGIRKQLNKGMLMLNIL